MYRYPWNEDSVRFMCRAGAETAYHRVLAEWIAPFLTPGGTLCDAGCGTGHLSLALSPFAGRIIAVDADEAPLSAFRDILTERKIQNVDPLCADIFSLPPGTRFDDMVFCFFGSAEEILSLAEKHCLHTVFLIKRSYRYHRFSRGSHPITGDSLSAAETVLNEKRIPYTKELLPLEMGQPFRDLNEARRFFEIYSRDGDMSLFTDEYLSDRLEKTGRADYPLYLRQEKEVGCIRIRREDL